MQISKIIHCMEPLESSYTDAAFRGAVLDNRAVKPGNIFFGCNGEKTDGNLFAQSALDNGAILAVMDNKDAYDKVNGNKVLVKNTIDTIKNTGKKRLAECCFTKIAITGSYGKTGTKEMLRLVLSTQYDVYASEGNQNNELGVCLTACGMPSNIEVGVFEVGTNAVGEIAMLSEIIKPDVVVLTGLGHAHIGRFGDISILAKEKLSIVDFMAKNGYIVAHEIFKDAIKNKGGYDFSLFYGRTKGADVRVLDIEIEGFETNFTIETKDGDYGAKINYPYPHLAENFLSAVIVGRLMNIAYEDIIGAALNYSLPAGRGTIEKYGKITVINDCYNASLESVEKAIDSLDMLAAEPKYALIGGIKEIDGFEKEIFSKLYNKARKTENVTFIFSGDSFKDYEPFENIYILEDEEETKRFIRGIDRGIILVKASRGYGFEKYINFIKGMVK